MANNGIRIAVASDTRAFLTGVKQDVLSPLQDTDKALKDLSTSGDNAGRDLTQSFSRQQQQTTALKDDIQQLNVQLKEGSKSATRSVVADSEERTAKTEQGFEEMKDSARQNAIQTAASFNGSFDSIGGGVQGLVSEFTAGFGPAGVVAGTAAAAGIGLAVSAIDNATQATQADKQAVADLTQQYIDAGTAGKRSFDDTKSALEKMAEDTDGSAIISLQDAYDEAGRAGANYADVVKSIASADPQQIAAALARVRALQQQDQILGRLGTTSANFNTRSQLGTLANQAAVTNLTKALQKAQQQATNAGRAQELAAEAGISQYQQKADLIGLLSKGYQDTAGNITDYLDKESGVLDVGKYIKAMEDRQKALDDYQTDLEKSRLTPEAKSYLDSQGADAAAAMLAGYKKASDGQKNELDRIWSAAGRSNAQSYGDAIGKDLNGLQLEFPPVKLPHLSRAQLEAVRREAQAYMDAHPLRASAVAYTPYGKPIPG